MATAGTAISVSMSDASSPEPESGGGRSSARSRPKAGMASSYAAISLLKENMQTVIACKPGDRTPSERDRSAVEEVACPWPPRQPNLKADLQQRTGPTKENAMLRAELEVLRQQNMEMANRLQIAENQLSQHNRRTSKLHSLQSADELHQVLGNLDNALQSAAADSTSAPAGPAGDVNALQPVQAEAAALQTFWLAHYWDLANSCGLYPEIAATRAAYWHERAPPANSVIASALHVMKLLQQQMEQALSGNSSTACTETACVVPEWVSAAAGKFSLSKQPSVTDVLEVERAMRHMHQLGVEAAVMAAMTHQATAQRTTMLLPQASQANTGAALIPLLPSAAEAQELQLQQAYMAYLWGRAALMAVQPQVSAARAQQWHCRMQKQPSVRDFEDVRQGLMELRILDVEQQIWQGSHICSTTSSCVYTMAHHAASTSVEAQPTSKVRMPEVPPSVTTGTPAALQCIAVAGPAATAPSLTALKMPYQTASQPEQSAAQQHSGLLSSGSSMTSRQPGYSVSMPVSCAGSSSSSTSVARYSAFKPAALKQSDEG